MKSKSKRWGIGWIMFQFVVAFKRAFALSPNAEIWDVFSTLCKSAFFLRDTFTHIIPASLSW